MTPGTSSGLGTGCSGFPLRSTRRPGTWGWWKRNIGVTGCHTMPGKARSQASTVKLRSMPSDLSKHKFKSLASALAEEELSASFDDDRDDSLQEYLYAEYLAAGSPPDAKRWLRAELATLFKSMGPRPHWIRRFQSWPFLRGRPMTFIGQLTVPLNEVSETSLSPCCVLYLFGSRVPYPDIPDSWEMQYRVVEQHESLAAVGRG